MKHIIRSTKTYPFSTGLSIAFRQPNADSHCHFIHGYAPSVHFEFGAKEKDKNGWVLDYGACKELKTWLQENFDHKTLVAWNDPYLSYFKEGHKLGLLDLRVVKATGMEAFAEEIATMCQQWVGQITQGRVFLTRLEMKEHEGNGVIIHLVEPNPFHQEVSIHRNLDE